MCLGTGVENLVACRTVRSCSLIARDRWEHELKIVQSSKLWAVSPLTPFIGELCAYRQSFLYDGVTYAKVLLVNL